MQTQYKNQTKQEIQRDGYVRIHDSLTAAKNTVALEEAVANSFAIIKSCYLDEYQVEKLESYGMKCFHSITRGHRSLKYIVKNRRY